MRSNSVAVKSKTEIGWLLCRHFVGTMQSSKMKFWWTFCWLTMNFIKLKLHLHFRVSLWGYRFGIPNTQRHVVFNQKMLIFSFFNLPYHRVFAYYTHVIYSNVYVIFGADFVGYIIYHVYIPNVWRWLHEQTLMKRKVQFLGVINEWMKWKTCCIVLFICLMNDRRVSMIHQEVVTIRETHFSQSDKTTIIINETKNETQFRSFIFLTIFFFFEFSAFDLV